MNGTVLEVTGFTADGVRLTYGYAQVINPIQGITSTEHINAAPAGTQAINGFTGYTGLSRHTMRTYLVTSENAERQQISQSRPIGLGPPRTEDVWANMARNLSRQPEKASSLDLRDRAQGPPTAHNCCVIAPRAGL